MKITIKEIAKRAGVSVGTVSKVIHNYTDVGDATRKRILDVMAETGYQAKVQRTKKRIGVIYGVRVSFNHPFFVEVMEAFSKEVGLLGYDLVFFSSKVMGINYVAKCIEAEVTGCIVIGGDEIQQSIYQLDESDIPCIGIDIQLTGNRSGYVMTNNMNMGKKVIEHLYLTGHRDIGYIGGLVNTVVGMEREEGFRNGLAEFGLTVNQDWMMAGDFSEESGYQAMKQILANKAIPSAMFVASDVMAFGAILAIRENGLAIPEDLAIVGCDDIEISKYTQPPLSTIRQEKDKIGRLAAFMLVDLINGVLESSSVVVDCELLVRKTS
ncbi:LacI family DNA-binding transcriptional regulator [Aquibacillus salsiterrae]|uniref:LacI family transcriptional regulator n=1 Tax=Aquibacillus salsiterrae TaxID=2950439 RepID=A0A9X4AG46_9BACI|nr:LacI family DNA-binding transcriptional regulator [Aquibacillus salsiterrae]MDC3416723.1 LacI family transcriptional regulator [Aquibacillus salsiterrae]